MSPKRESWGAHIDSSVAQGFTDYARLGKRKVGRVVEDALIEYMKNHPISDVQININQQVEKIVPVQQSIKIRIFTEKIQKRLDIIKRIIEKEHNPSNHVDELKCEILKLVDIPNLPESTIELLEEASTYL